MAGGKGERLSPLTQVRAKPAVPFGGIYRIIDFTLNNCVNSGLRKIHVLTQYKSISLTRHLRMAWNIFHSELGEYIDVIPAQQRVGEEWYKGTADSIYQNLYTVEMENPTNILILAGDHVYKMDYRKMIGFHVAKGADVTVGVVEAERKQCAHLGVIEIDGNEKIVGFAEKPKIPKTLPSKPNCICASMGIYIFKRSILEEELRIDAESKDSTHDFSNDIIPQMIRRKRKLYAFNFKYGDMSGNSYWIDIGSRDAYYEANMDLVQVTPKFNLYDREWPLRTYQEQFPPVKTVFSQTQEEGDRCGRAVDSLVSTGCIISGGLVQRSVLSPNVRVHSFAEIHDSVIMEGAEIGRYAKIKRAIIDKDVKILPNIQIGYNLEEDKKRFTISKKGVVMIPKGTVI